MGGCLFAFFLSLSLCWTTFVSSLLFLPSLSFLSLSLSLLCSLPHIIHIHPSLRLFFCHSFFRLLFVVLRVSAPRIHCFVFVPSYPSSLLLIKYYSNKNTSTSLPFPALPFTPPTKPHRTPSSYLSLHTLSHQLIYTFTHTHTYILMAIHRIGARVVHLLLFIIAAGVRSKKKKQEARNNEQQSTSLKRYCFSPSIP